MNDMERLESLVGKEFDYVEVNCCFIDEEEEVIITEYNDNYLAYYNTECSEEYEIVIDSNNIITEIR